MLKRGADIYSTSTSTLSTAQDKTKQVEPPRNPPLLSSLSLAQPHKVWGYLHHTLADPLQLLSTNR